MNRYVPLFRPVNFATLPAGVRWEYIEAPQVGPLVRRPDIKVSRHTYGVIKTDRPLTAEEIESFQMRPLAAE